MDELGWSGLGHMTEPDHHKYKDPNCIFVNPVNLQNLGTLGVEQFHNHTLTNFLLISIFLSSMSASIKKSKPKSDKVATNKTNITNNK